MAPKTGKKKRKVAEAEERAEAEAPAAGGGKKKKRRAAEAGESAKTEALAVGSGKAAEKADGPAEPAAPTVPAAEVASLEKAEEVAERREDAFSAAAVVFHTRGKDGKVSKILVAVEERKVQASYIGLPQTGKVTQRMVLFPMGRREKKDKADSVETARREYVEETGDFGGLAKYLDFADFDGGAEDEADLRGSETWTGRQNMAVFFAPARMIVLFCEVPAAAALDSSRAASGGVPLGAAGAAAGAAAEATEAKQTKKKRKKAEEAQINQNGTRATYKVGRTDHLEPTWLDAAALRGAVASAERSPVMAVFGQECRLFPTAASVLRLSEAGPAAPL